MQLLFQITLLSSIISTSCEDEVSCYSCKPGEDCEAAEDTTLKPAPSRCCFVVQLDMDDGVHYNRGEVHALYSNCTQFFCTKLGQDVGMEGGKVSHCHICSRNKCNDQQFPKVTLCYSCEDCAVVTMGTPKVRCALFSCCYSMTYKTSEFYNVTRGCVPSKLEDMDRCANTCELVKGKINTKATIKVCTKCEDVGDSPCNGGEIKIPSIKCRSCKDAECNDVPSGEVVCNNLCCYTEAFYTHIGMNYVRGCAEELVNCVRYCEATQSNLVDRIGCTSCNDEFCNVEKLPDKFECYECEGEKCNTVGGETPLKHCRGPQCCYMGVARFEPNKPFHAIRGCINWALGFPCNPTRTRYVAEVTFTKNHPTGRFMTSTSCGATDEAKCNAAPLPKSECYSCSPCNSITSSTTPKVDCNFPAFCYTMFSTKNQDEDTFASRGCHQLQYTVYNYACNELEKIHRKNYPEGFFLDCITCEAPTLCNGVVFIPKSAMSVQSPAVMCYQCDNCQFITGETKTTKCPQDTCCYTSRVRTEYSNSYTTSRGCIVPGDDKTCDNTCDNAERRFKPNNPNGKFYCKPCAKESGNNCNYDDLTNPDEETDKIESAMCYTCKDCHIVNTTTTNVYCQDSRCCYTVEIETPDGRSYMERACAQKDCSPKCSYYKDVTIKSCTVCDKQSLQDLNGCNSKTTTEVIP